MLQFLIGTNIPFMRFRRVAFAFSASLVVATVGWLIVNGGPILGVDFAGGTLLQIQTSEAIAPQDLRDALSAAGHGDLELQQIQGNDQNEYLVRLKSEVENHDPFPSMREAIQSRFDGVTVELRRQDTVGPKVGEELTKKALWAILGSLAGILLYVGIRYEFKFAFGAVVALLHDVFVTLGILCFTGREISLPVVAALLTIAGFSINDTIVVFDRIRERSRALRREKHSRVMDIAVNETLSRTVITSLTVFFTALALFIWGGEVLHDFSFAMVVGVVFGTYSSIYVASALALETWIGLDRRRGVQAE
jgi:preprotein translocase SecF subunit